MLQDIRIALRFFRRAPAPTAIALLSIALSVGATAVVFAGIKSVLIDALPYAHPEQLVLLRSEYPRMQEQSSGDWVFWNDAQEIIRRTRTLESVGIYRNAVFDLAGDTNSPPEALYGLMVTASLFPTLGVSPMRGRNILPEEDQPGHADVMILSYGLWVRRFHADPRRGGPDRHGERPRLPGDRRDAARLQLPAAACSRSHALALRRVLDAAIRASRRPFGRTRRGGASASRGLPGEARQDIGSIGDALAREFPATNRDHVLRLNFLRDRMVGGARNGLLLLMAAALLFMLIGCSNVANLLLARGLSRQREIAVRLAIGAGRGRIVRQLLTESCVLALAGGHWWFCAHGSGVEDTARGGAGEHSPAGRRARGFHGLRLCPGAGDDQRHPVRHGAGAEAGSGAIGRTERFRRARCRCRRARPHAIRAGGGGGRPLRGACGGRRRNCWGISCRLVAIDPGFQADRVLASVVLPSPVRYKDPEQRALFYRRILDAVRALPGVQSAGTVDALPFSGENHGGFVSDSEGGTGQVLTAEIDVTGGEYLQTMGVHLVEGRWFREEEMNPANDAAIVNTLVAGRLWPGASAVGQRICVYCTPENPRNWKRVIGVVSSASHAALDEPEKGNVYLAAGAMQTSVFLVLRTERPAGEMERAVRRAIAAIDPNQPVFLSVSMRDLIADSVADRRFIMMLLAITGCLALTISAAGIYGVISYTISRRTQEIGIRMAVGATPRHVFSLIFGQGFLTVAIGLAVGMGGALACMRSLRSVVVGLESVHAADVWMAGGLATVAAAIACWIPARRATKTDPISALRQE